MWPTCSNEMWFRSYMYSSKSPSEWWMKPWVRNSWVLIQTLFLGLGQYFICGWWPDACAAPHNPLGQAKLITSQYSKSCTKDSRNQKPRDPRLGLHPRYPLSNISSPHDHGLRSLFPRSQGQGTQAPQLVEVESWLTWPISDPSGSKLPGGHPYVSRREIPHPTTRS